VIHTQPRTEGEISAEPSDPKDTNELANACQNDARIKILNKCRRSEAVKGPPAEGRS
jgi:hypothetical protein